MSVSLLQKVKGLKFPGILILLIGMWSNKPLYPKPIYMFSNTEEISDAKMILAIDGKVQVKNTSVVFCCKQAEVIATKCHQLNTYNKCSTRAIECDNVVAYYKSKVTCYNVRSVTLYQKLLEN